jgi:hypothetical protein
MGPPERVLLQELILLELLSDSPAFVIGKCQSVLLEKSIDTWDTMVPAFFEIVKSQPSILRFSLLSLDGILCPYSLAVNKLRVPGLDVAIQIGNELIFFVRHTSSEMREPLLCLLGES